MFALKSRKGSNDSALDALNAHAGDSGRVLPRPLRRAVRHVYGLTSGRVAIPRYAGLASASLLFAATGLYGMVLGGHTLSATQAVASFAGFGLENVRVSGNQETSEIDILQQLELDGSVSLIGLDVAQARQHLLVLPWVRDAEVRKIYPDTVDVKLEERTAFAIWQHGEDLSLIEENGSVIAPLNDSKFTSLPLYVGRDAESAAAEFDKFVSNWPEIKSKVKAYVRVSGRRWDLQLQSGIVVKLPEENVARAMHTLSTMEAEQQLLERDIAAVDLRLEDRTSIQLSADAAARRSKLVEERDRLMVKAERNI